MNTQRTFQWIDFKADERPELEIRQTVCHALGEPCLQVQVWHCPDADHWHIAFVGVFSQYTKIGTFQVDGGSWEAALAGTEQLCLMVGAQPGMDYLN